MPSGKAKERRKASNGKIFLTARSGGMKWAAAESRNIAAALTSCRSQCSRCKENVHAQAVDVLLKELDEVSQTVQSWQKQPEVISISFIGNIVESNGSDLTQENIFCGSLGSDQNSLHNPWGRRLFSCGDFLSRNQNETYVFQSRTFQNHMSRKAFETSRFQINQHNSQRNLFLD